METVRYRIAKYVMRHQWASLLIMFALTAFFAVGAGNTQLKTVFSDLLPKNHPFVETYLDHPNYVAPLETVEIVISEKDDTGGSGANFLFDWAIHPGTPEPLFEGIMISTIGSQGLSFTTQGVRVW